MPPKCCISKHYLSKQFWKASNNALPAIMTTFIFVIFIFYYKVSEKAYRSYDINSNNGNFTKVLNQPSDYKLDYSPNNLPSRSSHNSSNSDMDLILIWTEYFEGDFLFYRNKDDKTNFVSQRKNILRPAFCEKRFPKCRVTTDRQFLNKSGMIIYHLRDLIDVPKYRTMEQLWILYNLESPEYSFPSLFNESINEVQFNGTANYHTSADIPVLYGEFEKQKVAHYNTDKIVAHKSLSLPIVWFVSNCDTASRREEYAEKLNRYIPVHIVGGCSQTRKCPKTSSNWCQQRYYRKYYFYLSFENSFCEDYVTEKLFLTMKYDIVPIVYGAANYSKILPPKSFIDATQYDPKDLAILLKSLMLNQTAYMEFFDWKRNFIVKTYEPYNGHLICSSCKYMEDYKRGKIPHKSLSLGQINYNWWTTCWDFEGIDY